MDLVKKLAVAAVVLSFLPVSPFKAMMSYFEDLPFLDVLNWFLPLSEMVAILEAWLLVITVFYTIMWALNYIGVLKG